jgi:prepilin-type N-terminal cleavage/methylation domain-containing protein
MTEDETTASRQQGFTLVELSIVLVIIGLVVGGAMVGKDLIRASEIKNIGADIERFEAARNTFRSKYNCLPGDCPFASSLGLGNNGNGNGYINHYAASNEVWLFWRHLSNAGLIGGSYSGLSGPDGGANFDAVVGTNIPGSKISGVGYSLYTPAPAQTSWSPALDGFGKARTLTDTVYIIGGDNPSNFYNTLDGFMSPIDAKTLDDKYDDGLANDGKWRVGSGSAIYNTIGCTSGVMPNYSYTNNGSTFCNVNYWFRSF